MFIGNLIFWSLSFAAWRLGVRAWRQRCIELPHLIDYLQRERQLRRGGALETRALTRQTLALRPGLEISLGAVRDILERARRLGFPLVEALERWRLLLVAALESERAKKRLSDVVLIRSILAVTSAWIGRLVLGATTSWEHLRQADQLALVLAAVMLVGLQLAFLRAMPTSWLWRGGLTTDATDWLASAITQRAPATFNLAGELKDLGRRELRHGVSLEAERRELLDAWASSLFAKEAAALRRLEECLPLFELVGVGLPVALILVIPITSLLAN